MAQAELLDVDTVIDEGFMYYLKARAFNTDAMILDYITLTGTNLSVSNNLDNYVIAYQGLLSDPLTTTRLTNTEAKDILNYMKYKQSNAYNNLTVLTLDSIDYGINIKRESLIHWRLYLEDSSDCNFMYVINGAQILNGLELVNFYCPYDDDTVGIAAEKTAFNSYIDGFVAESDKKKREIVDFKLFLKTYRVNNTVDIQDDFYADLITTSPHTHDKDNVITRLAASIRWKRRVLAKLL